MTSGHETICFFSIAEPTLEKADSPPPIFSRRKDREKRCRESGNRTLIGGNSFMKFSRVKAGVLGSFSHRAGITDPFSSVLLVMLRESCRASGCLEIRGVFGGLPTSPRSGAGLFIRSDLTSDAETRLDSTTDCGGPPEFSWSRESDRCDGSIDLWLARGPSSELGLIRSGTFRISTLATMLFLGKLRYCLHRSATSSDSSREAVALSNSLLNLASKYRVLSPGVWLSGSMCGGRIRCGISCQFWSIVLSSRIWSSQQESLIRNEIERTFLLELSSTWLCSNAFAL